MPICPNECISPCNCLMDEDGFRSGRGYPDGRRNTVVSGNGSIEDPYVIEFQMSGEYRPPAGEVRKLNEATVNNFAESIFNNVTVEWSSPNSSVFTLYSPAGLTALTVGNFHIVGASVSFNAVNTTGVRKLGLFGVDENGDTHQIAADGQHGSATRSTILSCSAFTSGVLTPSPLIVPTFSNTRINAWAVAVYQNSGGPLTVSTVKFWMGTL